MPVRIERAAVAAVAAPPVRDEAALLAALQRSDPHAWHTLLTTWLPPLLAYARRMVGDPHSAEEVVQDALVHIHAGLDRFEGRCSLKSWLYRAVHNRAIDELRRRKRFVEPPRDDDQVWAERFVDGRWALPPGAWEGSEGARLDARRLLEVVASRLDTLPHQHREVLLMKEVHGLAAEEICDVLGISPANLRVCLFRARRALRDAVAQTLEVPDAVP